MIHTLPSTPTRRTFGKNDVSSVGLPRIELGSRAPKARILPLYYSPTQKTSSGNPHITTGTHGTTPPRKCSTNSEKKDVCV